MVTCSCTHSDILTGDMLPSDMLPGDILTDVDQKQYFQQTIMLVYIFWSLTRMLYIIDSII